MKKELMQLAVLGIVYVAALLLLFWREQEALGFALMVYVILRSEVFNLENKVDREIKYLNKRVNGR